MYKWKIQQGEGGQQKTTVDKTPCNSRDLVMLTVSGTKRVILSEGEGSDVVYESYLAFVFCCVCVCLACSVLEERWTTERVYAFSSFFDPLKNFRSVITYVMLLSG